jgi:hypothetical protein
MLTKIKGVEVGIAPIGVTVARGVGVAVRVGVRVKVCVAVAVGLGVSTGFSPGKKSRAEQACTNSIVRMIRAGLHIYNLIYEGLFLL